MVFDKNLPMQERLNFIVYALSRFVLSVGKYVYLFAVSYYILYETGSALYFSVNMAISIATTVLLLPFSGVLSDFGNKRRIIITGETMNSIILLGFFLYTMMYDVTLLSIYLVTFLTSMIEPFISNAFQAAMTELFHKDRIQKVMGYTSAILSSTVILGPILGGALFGLLSFNHIIMTFLIAYIISAALDFLMDFKLHSTKVENVENNDEGGGMDRFKRDISQGFIFIAGNEVFKSLLLIGALINFMAGVITIFPEKMMIHELSLQPGTVGIINAIGGLGVLAGGVAVARMRGLDHPFLLMKRGMLAFAGLVVLYLLPLYLNGGLISHILIIGSVGIGIALALQFINIPINLFVQLVTPQHVKGRVFSVMNLCSMSIMPVGAIFYGFLYDFELYWLINAASAVLMIAVVLLFFNEGLLAKSNGMYIAAKAEAGELEREPAEEDAHPGTDLQSI